VLLEGILFNKHTIDFFEIYQKNWA
jgi:hypothetical protein